MKNLTFNFKSIVQTKARWLLTFCALLTLSVGPVWAATRTFDGTEYIYINKSLSGYNWSNDNAKVWIYVYKDGSGDAFVQTTISGDVMYAQIPSGTWSHMMVVRRSSSSTGPFAGGDEWQRTKVQFDATKNYLANAAATSDGNESSSYSWGICAGNPTVYFDNSTAQWGNYKQFMIGHGSYSTPYTLGQISGTQLWYTSSIGYWGGYTDYAVFQNSSEWGSEGNSISYRSSYATKYTKSISNDILLGHALLTYGSSESNQTLSKTDLASYSNLDRTITIKEAYNSTGDGAYTEITSGGETFGTISASGKKFDSWTTCAGNSSASLTKESTTTFSASASFGYTSTVRLTATATKAGKAFVGWYTSTGSLISSNTTYDYTVIGDATIFAYYKDEETHDVTVKFMCGENELDSYTESAVGVTTTRSVAVRDFDQYEFTGWDWSANGVTSSSSSIANPVVINSVHGGSNFTLIANYKKWTRLYFSNPNSWSNVYAYVWDGSATPDASGKNANWPGVEITSTKIINCRTCYYYEYDATAHPTWVNIIFNDGGSNQTADLTISEGSDKYYNGSAWIGDFTEHTITVTTEDPGHGSVSGGGSTRVDGGDGCIASVTATPAAGYRFKQWEVTSGTATVTSPTSATSTVTASTNAVVKATFTTDGFVYLDKSAISSSWGGTPYVYFYSAKYWDKDGKGSGSKTGGGITVYGPYEMRRIGDSQIWYYDYSTTPGVGTTKNIIAFNDHSQENYDNFVACLAIYRGDFYQKQNMFVVKDYKYYYNTSAKEGQAVYYNDGYWRKFNDTDPGYVIKTYNGFAQGSSLTGTYNLRSAEPGASNCIVDIPFNSGTNFFKVLGCDTTTINGIPYAGTYYRDASNGTMNTDNCTNWLLTDGNGSNTGVLATASANYTFTLTLGAGSLYISVDFPLAVGDFRLMYDGKMRTTYNSKKKHPSNFIRKLKQPTIADDTTRVDTISFFIDPASGDLVPSLSFQHCSNIEGYTIYWRDTLSAIDLSSITKAGTYNFIVTQTNNKSGTHTISCVLDKAYSGNYYIRTNSATGGWKSYKVSADNMMTFSDYAKKYSGYDYYFCKWVNTDANVKFTIANDYSECITDTVDNDAIVTRLDPNNGKLPYQASVRFMYNSATNDISRAYLNGSSEGIADYLYIMTKDGTSEEIGARNDSIKNADGSAITSVDGYKIVKFEDNNNWVYVKNIQAREGTHVRLISDYYDNSSHHYQYLKGSDAGTWTPASTSQIIGGTSGEFQTLRMVYDFKTNQLLAAWMPSGSEIDEELPIYADVMIIREAQGDAKQITFGLIGDSEEYGSLTDVKTVYGVMQFNKYTLNNQSKTGEHDALSLSVYDRDLYWISFPFDVNLNDVFGFGTYGTHWIIEYYDGKGRAKNGFWADSPSNWKFVYPYMRDTFKLKANEGYILALDLDEMNLGTNTGVWANNVTNIYLYFPSSASVGSITQTDATLNIDQKGYQCTIGPRFDGGDDRTIKDSYWHCIGVPSFANTTHGTNTGWTTGAGADAGAVDAGDYPNRSNWTSKDLPYLYEWVSSDNTLRPVNSGSATFKAMYSYLVQYNKDTIKWMQVTTPTAAAVAARIAETPDREYKLVLRSEERTEDQTYVRLTDDEGISQAFEFNFDLSKEMNKNRGNIWTVTADTVEVAGNSMPKPVQTTVVPVGVKVVANGEYTFSMPEGTNGENVVLIDNAYGTRTNLGLMPYTVTLTAGTYDSRFALEFGPIQDAPTGIDEMSTVNYQLSTEEVRKVFVGGRLYIIRDGKVYDAAGQRVE